MDSNNQDETIGWVFNKKKFEIDLLCSAECSSIVFIDECADLMGFGNSYAALAAVHDDEANEEFSESLQLIYLAVEGKLSRVERDFFKTYIWVIAHGVLPFF